jgi:hypothetical protein
MTYCQNEQSFTVEDEDWREKKVENKTRITATQKTAEI